MAPCRYFAIVIHCIVAQQAASKEHPGSARKPGRTDAAVISVTAYNLNIFMMLYDIIDSNYELIIPQAREPRRVAFGRF
jgi:hypothetical protein